MTAKILGQSSSICELRRCIEHVASKDVWVLVLGESGVGKELTAQAIHENSPRKNKPLVSLNCATIPETLLESELFGHAMNRSERRGPLLAGGGEKAKP